MGITSPSQNSYTLDIDHLLKDDGVIGASAVVATTVDLGSAYYSGSVVIDVTALEVATGNEMYDIVLQGTNVAAFGTDTDIWDVAQIAIGAATPKRTDANSVDTVGRYIMGFTNRLVDTYLQYFRLYTIVEGTVATGIDYSAYIARNPGS